MTSPQLHDAVRRLRERAAAVGSTAPDPTSGPAAALAQDPLPGAAAPLGRAELERLVRTVVREELQGSLATFERRIAGLPEAVDQLKEAARHLGAEQGIAGLRPELVEISNALQRLEHGRAASVSAPASAPAAKSRRAGRSLSSWGLLALAAVAFVVGLLVAEWITSSPGVQAALADLWHGISGMFGQLRAGSTG
jgi:hypothetical protein